MAGQISTIRLSRYDAQPWGFRLQGGMDFGTPLVVQKVNGGSLSEQAGLLAGDALLKVNNVDVYNMRHKDAQDLIVRSGNNFDITIQRGGSVWRPQVTPTGSLPSPTTHLNQMSPVTKTSLAHKHQEIRHIGSGHNSAARPFSSVNGGDGQVKSIVNKQYNTPVGIYSEEAIAETLSAQAEVLAGGVLGVNFKKNEKIYNAANSEVLKMLHEQENDKDPDEPHAPANFFWTASHAVGGAAGVKSHRRDEEYHQQQQQQLPGPHEDECIGTPLQQNTLAPSAPHRPSLPTQAVSAPTFPSYPPPSTYYPSQQPQSFPPQSIPAPISAVQPPAPAPIPKIVEEAPKHGGGMACESCGVTIAGVFVRIKDKNLHAECFKCATCGTNLKNQGYYNFNNKLYCDIHARLAAMNNPPKGTEGYSPVPIKPSTQLSANTISAALNTHSQHNGSNINTGYGGPKPFNSSPMSPPMRGPQSPSTYPPPTNVQSWDQPRPQPKPQVNPYATLPRTTGQSQGNINHPPPLPNLTTMSDEIKNQVGKIDSLDLPPPPPPLPGALNGNNSLPRTMPTRAANQLPKTLNTGPVTGNRTPKPFQPGTATEMLASSLEKVEINDKQKFRDEAGKIISAMLENRLAQKTNTSLTKELDSDHPMKKIIDVCDNPQTKVVSEPSVDANINQTSGLILEVSTDGKILSGSPTEHGPSESVVYRNKSTNPNSKRELSTHAFDRRSYIDTNSNNNQDAISQEVNGNTDNTTTLVSDLKDGKEPVCCQCNAKITRGPFITALGRIWCPDHFVCVNGNCRRALQDIGFVEEKGDLYCEFCFEKFLAPTCSKCSTKIKGDCLNAIGKHYHPECFSCSYCGKHFGNSPFFLEEGEPYCEADWNELFTTKCFACGFPVEAGDRWVEALSHNYHSQCFNCTMCKKNLEGQSFYNKGGRPFCKNHAR